MLLINEIYPAICGESRFVGRPCVLVRLTGCHLRCRWCDSEHSFQGGERREIAELVDCIEGLGIGTVLVTGGEPLLQRHVVGLMDELLAAGFTVLLETSGTRGPDAAVALQEVPRGVHRIVDLKAPGSGIDGERIDWSGIRDLGATDELKIVCADRTDYEWAREQIGGDRIPSGLRVALSPVHGELDPARLAEWVLEDRLDAVVQIQLHRALWPDRERGV